MKKGVQKEINKRLAKKLEASRKEGEIAQALNWNVCPECAGTVKQISSFFVTYWFTSKISYECLDCGSQFSRHYAPFR